MFHLAIFFQMITPILVTHSLIVNTVRDQEVRTSNKGLKTTRTMGKMILKIWTRYMKKNWQTLRKRSNQKGKKHVQNLGNPWCYLLSIWFLKLVFLNNFFNIFGRSFLNDYRLSSKMMPASCSILSLASKQ